MPAQMNEDRAVATTIWVARTVKSGGEPERQTQEPPEQIEVHRFATNPAMVRVSYPLKLSRSYQSIGVEVGVELPCYAEEVDRAFLRATDIVVGRLKEEVPKLVEMLRDLEAVARGS